MAPADRRAAWGARITLGIGLSSVVGVPAGTLIGDLLGWRATFWALAALSLAATLLLLRGTVPEPPPSTPGARPTAPGTTRPRFRLPGPLLLVALVITLGTAGVFALYTYASPYLTQAAGFGPQAVTVLLLVYGAGGIVGNTVGGRAADRSPYAAVLVTLGAATAGLLLLALLPGSRWAVAVLFCLLGAAYFGTIPALNTQTVTTVRPSSPTMALTINNSAFCVGIALGSWLGGLLLAHDRSLPSVAAAGATLTAAALLLAAACPGRRNRPAPTTTPELRSTDTTVTPAARPTATPAAPGLRRTDTTAAPGLRPIDTTAAAATGSETAGRVRVPKADTARAGEPPGTG
ncbi:DHA1 family inner membrane transport protein [Streptomyces sp. 3330]|uniref:MFS transporter n=1 Tax=Streptomyces sp. 3330 TaxID=2817755 RepID=UPI0028569D9C|nr:MFS transporter [Streptomyces sp. 3330]MDR6974173.1 DHA1 family inner membrane transport protein [Streptomyces sp. 3330]